MCEPTRESPERGVECPFKVVPSVVSLEALQGYSAEKLRKLAGVDKKQRRVGKQTQLD